ncbi:MAG TPA: S41 family peptidase [Candidatus Babeliaceae bacterium]|nr:S41 family peptidase [Candidatus Babeliaceae bacterium]
MKRSFTLLLVTLSLFGASSSNAQIDTISNLSNADKLFGLSKFWSETKYNFAFFDHANVNWDSTYQAYIPKILATKSTWQYYQVMARFCALLKDGHTSVGFPYSIQHKSRYKWIDIENFDKRFYVTNMPVEYKDKVPLGSELISVDGVPVMEYMEKEALPYINASSEHTRWNLAAFTRFLGPDTTQIWRLKLRTPKGKMIDYDYQFHTHAPKWEREIATWHLIEFKMINDIGYLKMNDFSDTSLVTRFKALLPQLYKCKGIILDIRENDGGDTEIGVDILKYFTDKKLLIGSAWKTRDNIAAYKAWGVYALKNSKSVDATDNWSKKIISSAKGDYWLKGDTMKFENDVTAPKINCPLIVLTGNHTVSAAEDFVIFLNGIKPRAITMGQRTEGSTGQPLPIDLPGLSGGRICTKRDTYPDGRDFVGIGIIPDIEVPRRVEDVINGRDGVLDAALKQMKKEINR